MSLKNKHQRKSNVNLFFNQQINIFPEDFFSTYDKKSDTKNNTSTKEKTKKVIPHPKIINLMKSQEQSKTYSQNNNRNPNKNNEEMSKNNYINIHINMNIINSDINCNTDFSFQAPQEKKKTILNSKNHSMSVINKKKSFKPLFRSPLNKKMENEKMDKNCQKSNDNIININNNSTKRKNKIYSHNIKCNELFKENKLTFLKEKNLQNIALYTQKEKDKNLSKVFNRNENKQNNYKNYRMSTPVIKNRVIKKILNINKSKEVLKSS